VNQFGKALTAVQPEQFGADAGRCPIGSPGLRWYSYRADGNADVETCSSNCSLIGLCAQLMKHTATS